MPSTQVHDQRLEHSLLATGRGIETSPTNKSQLCLTDATKYYINWNGRKPRKPQSVSFRKNWIHHLAFQVDFHALSDEGLNQVVVGTEHNLKKRKKHLSTRFAWCYLITAVVHLKITKLSGGGIAQRQHLRSYPTAPGSNLGTILGAPGFDDFA